MLDGEGNRGGRAELVGVDLRSKAEPPRDIEISRIELLASGRGLPREVGKLSETAPADLGQEFAERPFRPGVDAIFTGGIAVRQAEEESRHDLDRMALQGRQDTKQFRLGAHVRPAAGLGLHRGGPVARHGFQVGPHPYRQSLASAGAYRPNRRRIVARPRPGRRKHQVRVAIYKAGHHHASRGVDVDRALRGRQVFDSTGRPNFLDDPVSNQQRAILDNSQFQQFRPSTGSFGAAQRHQLARAADQNIPRNASPNVNCNITYSTYWA